MSEIYIFLTDEALAELLQTYEQCVPWLNIPDNGALLCLRELVAKRAEVTRLLAEVERLQAQVEFDKGDRAYMVELLDKQADQIKHLLRIKDDTVDFLAKE